MSKVYIEVLKFTAVTSTAQNTQQVVYYQYFTADQSIAHDGGSNNNIKHL